MWATNFYQVFQKRFVVHERVFCQAVYVIFWLAVNIHFFSILYYDFYPKTIFSYDDLNAWASDKCTPLVREITFENAEELTEEGLPFLILFHAPEDNESIKRYTDIVQRELMEDKRKYSNQFAPRLKKLS